MATGNETVNHCLTLAPFRECLFGDCVNGTCVCYPGWSQNLEFLYRDVDPTVTSYCDYNAVLQVTIVSVIFVLVVGTTILQSMLVTSSSHVRRLLPFYIGQVFLLYAAVTRMARPYDNLYGFDIAYSWIFMLLAGCLLVQIVIFFNKYLVYALKLFEFKRRTKWLSLRFKVFSYMIAILVLAVFIAWPLETVLDSPSEKQILQRVATGYVCFFHLVMLIMGSLLLTKYLADLKSIIEDNGLSQVDATLQKRCKAMMRRTRRVRRLAGLGNLFSFITNLLCTVYEGWAKLYGLLIFLAIIIMEIAFLAVMRAIGKGRLTQKFEKFRDESKRVIDVSRFRRKEGSSRKKTNPKESITNTNDI